ncbi:MAG: acetyl-CoA C-acetyltransferase [Lactobacillus sp.]|jgi:acetyl-CoA C-acetyltransferase|uniref:acetyl-CoA C-acetyltransferase n=1 Tax=Lacticaseibacillus suilingensis TaxID=2799577 RepID=UPI0022E7D268|nr:acetyl-CoA C-acetyltransferase [Lacticaseibacillus suilingensis]MCI1893964.1 acetyl-CoA C-acetyltransferase [Lactobacillus sp.]MCI1918436.1 acetyl-CoA C-acetyltransferase [Lactobacillus sp.]MCI1941822.1 acetyl-CoA C-acetyltransferase [Lactobacillus sp.]MCI1972596.1 acetyl-CoA C-acetyltransferase [Lactobacillus sp.]MCI2017487.1 acetyl-CoA C-acetyltransferase [Lactobacillus sp.]
MTEVVILSAARTPIGKFGGALAGVSAVELGAIAAKAAIQRAGIAPERLDQAIFGNVLQANSGQNVARQIALKAGLTTDSTAMTINEVCGSGLKAVRLGQSAILLGDADAVLVGGTENMSQAPFYAPQQRFGHKFGDVAFVDGLARDGLSDAFTGLPMGVTAENVAEQFSVTREQQDRFALASHQKAVAAQQAGAFDAEITPVTVTTRKGDILVAADEGPRPDTDLTKLGKLKPAFKPEGTVTAGNASGINDGAAALILMRKDLADAQGLPYLAVIDGYNEGGIDPNFMGYAPKRVIEKLLKRTATAMSGIDLIEINEAFAAQSIAVAKELELDQSKLNVNGGAIALGHPLGASGARVLTTLLYALRSREAQTGIAALCVGGGIGVAMQVSRP